MLHLSLPETPGRFNPLSSITKRGRAAIVAALEAHNMRAKITPALIASLRPPTDRPEAFIWDEEVRGWGIRLLRSGTASWVTQVKVKGQPVSKRQTFARVSKLPYTLAKERARHIVALAELGRDWYAERAAEEAARGPRTRPRRSTIRWAPRSRPIWPTPLSSSSAPTGPPSAICSRRGRRCTEFLPRP